MFLCNVGGGNMIKKPSWFGFHLKILEHFVFLSLGAGNLKSRASHRGLWRALVGAQQHLVLGGVLRAAGLLLHQELLEPAGGESESLTLELHQVGVLKPGLGEAVPGRCAGPESSNENTDTAQTGSESDAPSSKRCLTKGNCSASF